MKILHQTHHINTVISLIIYKCSMHIALHVIYARRRPNGKALHKIQICTIHTHTHACDKWIFLSLLSKLCVATLFTSKSFDNWKTERPWKLDIYWLPLFSTLNFFFLNFYIFTILPWTWTVYTHSSAIHPSIHPFMCLWVRAYLWCINILSVLICLLPNQQYFCFFDGFFGSGMWYWLRPNQTSTNRRFQKRWNGRKWMLKNERNQNKTKQKRWNQIGASIVCGLIVRIWKGTTAVAAAEYRHFC